MSPIPISVQLYTVRELLAQGDPYDVIQRIADMGYDGVEGTVGDSPSEFARRIGDMGLKASSYFGPVPTLENVDKFVETALALGVKHTSAGFWVEDFATIDAIKRTADKLNEVLPTIRKAGLTLSIHNHWIEYEQVEGRLIADRFAELAPGVGYELDIYWAANFGALKSEEMVARFRDRIYLMHVKDGPITRDLPMLAVGDGAIDVPACILAADPDKLDWLIVELDAFDGDIMTAVSDSYRYLVGEGFAQGRKSVH